MLCKLHYNLFSQREFGPPVLTMANCWRLTKRTIGQGRIYTGFRRFFEIGRFFHSKYIIFLATKMLSKLKSGSVGLALRHIQKKH